HITTKPPCRGHRPADGQVARMTRLDQRVEALRIQDDSHRAVPPEAVDGSPSPGPPSRRMYRAISASSSGGSSGPSSSSHAPRAAPPPPTPAAEGPPPPEPPFCPAPTAPPRQPRPRPQGRRPASTRPSVSRAAQAAVSSALLVPSAVSVDPAVLPDRPSHR